MYEGSASETLLPLASYAVVVTRPFGSSSSTPSPKVLKPLVVTGWTVAAVVPSGSDWTAGAVETARLPASS